MSIEKLKKFDLKANFDNIPLFKHTGEFKECFSPIGQDKAIDSLNLGLEMDKKNYNIYVSGPTGIGKTTYVLNRIKEFAKKLPTPMDWVYVYNFKEPKKPVALCFEAGRGMDFKISLETFIEESLIKVTNIFESKKYDTMKNRIVQKYEKKFLKSTEELHSKAREYNFSIERDESGNYVFIPLLNGNKMSMEQYNLLKPEDKNTLTKRNNELRIMGNEMAKTELSLKQRMIDEIKIMEKKLTSSIITDGIQRIKSEFGGSLKIDNYLDMLQEDILSGIEKLTDVNKEDETLNTEQKKVIDIYRKKYSVNVFVAKKKGAGAPVIFEDCLDYTDIFGKIEYENVMGNVYTDFTMIYPGSIHRANGGYLIMRVESLLSNPAAWAKLKRSIKLDKITLQNPRGSLELVPILTINPEDIPLNLKVILIGNDEAYNLLSIYDMDFKKLFKIKAEFDNRVEKEDKNLEGMIGLLSDYVKKNNLRHITRDGVIEIFEYSSRLSESKKYLTSSLNKIHEVIDIADLNAKEEGSEYIDGNNIRQALYEIRNMNNLIEQKILEMFKDKKYLLENYGAKVGQINGLSVTSIGDLTLGQPHRITVTSFAGEDGVINIEREAGMSGNIHDKGVLILSGYIGELVGREVPISFNANIVFEQLYSEIDGDSASAAELTALISSLSDIPIKQNFAITGSVNQKGEIQPIGGVNDKIEGYFKVLSLKGLDGSHGVIIPKSNLDDLALNDEVEKAVLDGLFNIYTIDYMEDVLNLLLDIKESYKDKTIIELVKERIVNKMRIYKTMLE